MEIQGLELRYADVPAGFVHCFNAACPRSGSCLRYAVGQCVPPGPAIGACVFPNANPDADCPYHRSSAPIERAWGFGPLFKDVLSRHETSLRHQLISYLGSRGTYYRYNRGRYKLTPQQQADVMKLFANYGYDTANLKFANYEKSFDFRDL